MKAYEIQKTLGAVALLLVTLAVVLHLVWLRPKANHNQRLRKANAELETKLVQSTARKWPLDPDVLNQIRQQFDGRRDKQLDQLLEVLKRANKQYEPLFDPTQNGIRFQEWKLGVTLFDYQERYVETKTRLGNSQVYLNDEYLGLAENSAPAEGREDLTYRLVARLYTAQAVARLCREHNLRLDNPKDTAKPQAAQLKSLPVRVYVTKAADAAFVEEYPVQVTVRGRLADLCRFLESLTAGERFLPLDRLSVCASGAENFLKPGGQLQAQDEVEATLICSGFIFLTDIEKLRADRATANGSQTGWRPGA